MARAKANAVDEGRQRIIWIVIGGLALAGVLYLLVGRVGSAPPNAGSGKYYYTGKMVPHGIAATQGQGPQ